MAQISNSRCQSALLRASRDTSRPSTIPARPMPTSATRCWNPSRSAAEAPDWPWSVSMVTIRSPGLPWRLIGQRLHARTAGDIVQIFADNEVVATHVAPPVRAGHRLRPLPAGEAFAMKSPTWCRHTTAEVGPACEAVITEFMRDNAIHHLRSARGVLGLRDKHGCQRL